ncbi:MAG: ABC transporter ATP-binding protein [Spirochaetales bacterium]|nr:ABC transporter ATP-binding protein [Spirochaetales bacterium]
MESILTLEKLTYIYPRSESGIRGIDFSLEKGEKHGIIGANGAGKSTLLQLITGLLNADSGEIRLEDQVLTKKNLNKLRGGMGLLFQNSDDQLFSMTIEDDVRFGPLNMGMSFSEASARAGTALDEAGISHLAGRAPHTLSGGEKKSAALATLLSMDPELLLLDEPTAGLDPRSRRGLITIIERLSHSMMIVSHDLDFIWDCCSRVSILHQGTIVKSGETDKIFSDRILLEQYGLELPLQLQRCVSCEGKN